MKQYDRVTGSEKVTDHNGTHWHAQNYTNAIVTTIEELKECFKWGMASYEDTKGSEECFNEFLKTQGIQPDK